MTMPCQSALIDQASLKSKRAGEKISFRVEPGHA